MISFFLLSVPIFAVLAVGWAAIRMQISSPQAIGILGAFSFRFGMPALVFRLISGQPFDHSFNAVFYAGYLISGLCIFSFVLFLSLIFNSEAIPAASARATTASVSNLGFLGPPLMLAFFGERGAGPLAMAILAEVMVLFSLGGLIMCMSRGATTSVIRLVFDSTALNPIVAAIILGVIFAATGLTLPAPIDRFLSFLGGSAGPTALFALGGTLAIHRVDYANAVGAAGVLATKLIIYPALVWFILNLLQVEAFWLKAGVLVASLPTAGIVYVLAQRYQADTNDVSAAIVLSTVVSVITVPFTAWLMLR